MGRGAWQVSQSRRLLPLAQSGPKKPAKQWQCPATHSPFPLQSVEQPSIESAPRKQTKTFTNQTQKKRNNKILKMFHM